MEREHIKYLLETGNFAVINESNGKMLRDVGEGIELYDSATDSFPSNTYKDIDRAITWLLN